MNSLTRVVALIALLLVAFSSARAAENAALSGDELRARHDYFERKVRPLLTNRCQKCHGSVRQLGALRLDTAQGMFYGSTNGAVVVPGNPDASVLVQLARSKDERRMPPPRHPDDYESKELRDLFDDMDLNGDGKVSYDELVDFLVEHVAGDRTARKRRDDARSSSAGFAKERTGRIMRPARRAPESLRSTSLLKNNVLSGRSSPCSAPIRRLSRTASGRLDRRRSTTLFSRDSKRPVSSPLPPRIL